MWFIDQASGQSQTFNRNSDNVAAPLHGFYPGATFFHNSTDADHLTAMTCLNETKTVPDPNDATKTITVSANNTFVVDPVALTLTLKTSAGTSIGAVMPLVKVV